MKRLGFGGGSYEDPSFVPNFRPPSGEFTVFRYPSPVYRVVRGFGVCVMLASLLVVIVSLAVGSPVMFAMWGLALLLILTGFVAMRMSNIGLYVSHEQVVIMNLLSTHVLDPSDIEATAIRRSKYLFRDLETVHIQTRESQRGLAVRALSLPVGYRGGFSSDALREELASVREQLERITEV